MNKILKHISFAHDWLDKAEEKIKTNRIVDGEVYLSLAEAEVRKAWEDSYSSRRQVDTGFSLSQKKLVSVLLGIILILVVTFTNYLITSQRTDELELKLTDGYWLREESYSYREERDIRLININLMEENNSRRR